LVPRIRSWWRFATALLVVIVIGAIAVTLNGAQARNRSGLSTRFAARGALAAGFVSTYVTQLLGRESAVASATLTGPAPTAAFNSDVAAFAFPAAVLLDSNGRVLAVAPSAPALVGQAIAGRYAHLSAAIAGRQAVSNVVPSAVAGAPVVAFAVPFNTPSGRRVLSGAYVITQTPLSAFLNDSTTLKGARIYLVDATGTVLASGGQPVAASRKLAAADPALQQATTRGVHGTYNDAGVSRYFARSPVAGTGWTLVLTAPSSGIFLAVDGSSRWEPWVLLLALSLLAGVAGWLAVRLVEGRRRLTFFNDQLSDVNDQLNDVNDKLSDANVQLSLLAHTDSLSGLLTRRSLLDGLTGMLADAARYRYPVSVLMVDIDHFKALNDDYGHLAGDHAIKHIADRLSAALRTGDVLGRWGGEEFVAVLPHTALADAHLVAERLCEILAGTPIEIGDGKHLVTIQTSVGVAEHAGESLEQLINRADVALYEAKAAGRNTVRSAP
jgi:diguanylate cyclase (GGDEF)-like protein